MTISDATLIAYVEGELEPAARAVVEAAVRSDPDVAAALARHQKQRGRPASTDDAVVEEPPAEELEAFIRAAVGPAAIPAEVIDLAARRKARDASQPPSAPPRWAALAACFVCGLIVAAAFGSTPPGLLKAQGRTLLAQGRLTEALDHDLASEPRRGRGIVQLGLSFRSRDGAYCRTFSAADGPALSGVACRDGAAWTVRAAAFGAATATSHAPSALAPAVQAAVDGLILGSPLDAKAEIAARLTGWRRPVRAIESR